MRTKIISLVAALILTCSANAFAAFAWITTSGGAATVTVTGSRPTFAFKPSNKVVFGYDVEATGGISYTLGTFHETGTRTYATTSTDTVIYYFDNAEAGLANTIATATKPGNAPATATTLISWGAGWTSAK